jgi:hypothetical protein
MHKYYYKFVFKFNIYIFNYYVFDRKILVLILIINC